MPATYSTSAASCSTTSPWHDHDILVLGAGGFSLSHREPLNRYTFVDIDPAIRGIAEREFLREAAAGEFIATDARRFVADTGRGSSTHWWSTSTARARRFPAIW
jgi:spermidine synthase